MSFTIPDVAAAWNAIQARVQSGDIQIITDGASGVGIISGCAVSPQGTPDMTVTVASGSVRIGGSTVAVTSGNVTITANATGNPRLDLICVNGSGTKSAQAGTAAAAPKYPAIPGSSVVLAAVLVPTGASSITSNNIVDKRMTVVVTTGLLAANNLSDLVSASTARTNLGLGTMATQAASAVAITGGTITGLGTPSASSDAATKTYVDTVAGAGTVAKLPVRAATTANITLSGAQTIDGVSVVAGDRVLVKNQTTGSQNGIYAAATGAWSRAADSDSSGEMPSGTTVYVISGSASGNRFYGLSTTGAITLGTTSLTFSPITYAVGTASGTVAAGDDSRFSFPSSVTSTAYLKQPTRVATTANITLSGGQTIDGVALSTGDRVLVKDQSTGSQNGLYVVASGAWSRATDADTSAEVLAGLNVYVNEGTANGNKLFSLTTNDPITLGTTSLTFSAAASGGASALDDLSDVVITSAAQNNVLKRNATQWVNVPGQTIDASLYSSAQAAIDASASGDTVVFSQDYTVSATLSLAGGRKYDFQGHTVSQANGANLDAVVASAGWLGVGASPTSDSPIVLRNLQVDGNRTNQTSGAGHGLVIMSFWSVIDNVWIFEARGDGIRPTAERRDTTAITNTAVENFYLNCRVYACTGVGIHVVDSSFNKMTDGWIVDCIVGGPENDAIKIDSAAGWFVKGCHLYGGATGPIGRHGIHLVKPNWTTVDGNYIEPYGHSVVYPAAGIAAGDGDESYANGSCTITNNVIRCTDVAGGVDTDAHPRGIICQSTNGGAGQYIITGNVLFGSTHPNFSIGIEIENQTGTASTSAVMAGNYLSGWDLNFYSYIQGTLKIEGQTPGDGGAQFPAYAASVTPDPYLGEHIFVGALTGNLAIASTVASDGIIRGKRMTFYFTQDATGTRTVTFNAIFKKAGGAFTASTGSGARCSIGFVYDGTSWVEVSRSLALA